MRKFEITGKIIMTDQHGNTLFEKDNLFVDTGFEVIASLFFGDFTNKQIGFIQIGEGGDLDNLGVDTGLQNPPAVTDTSLRDLIFEKAVLKKTQVSATTIRYETFLDALESNSELINEFGLVAQDKTMLSHVVTDPDPGIGGRATRLEKSDGLIASLAWELTISRCP